ncbi:MAG: helix-turn-helix domain-containing protein, partial [Chthonomonadales bacterium]
MLSKSLDQVTQAELEKIVEASVPESVTLEYKAACYGSKDQDKLELAKDVAAMANTHGGFLIIGIKEKNGQAAELTGVQLPDPDKEIQRMLNILDAHVEPKIHGVNMQPIGLEDGRWAFVLRVPRSLMRPHAVRNGEWRKWPARNSNGTYFLDVPQIRNAFLFSQTVAERMRAFRIDRIAQLGDLPRSNEHMRLVYHILPLSAFDADAEAEVDLQVLA